MQAHLHRRPWLRALPTLILLCAVAGCPPTDDAADAGTTGPTTPDAGSGGHNSAGTSGQQPAAGSGGQAGSHSTAGSASAGQGGSPPQAGSGAAGGDEDAGVEPGTRCATRGGATCSEDEFCNFEPDTDCGATDRGGMCEAKPEICTTIYAPVCACDSHTYASACTAHGAGVSVRHEGVCSASECVAAGGYVAADGGNGSPCKTGEASWETDGGTCCLPKPAAGKTCGGIAALECGAGQFCNYEPDAGGQGCDGAIADAAGTCQVQPNACTKEYKPVCGCDHRTYGNTCSAHAEGVSVLHDGACTVSDCTAIGGRAVAGNGPPPMCASDEQQYTSIINDNGSMPIEGMACCV